MIYLKCECGSGLGVPGSFLDEPVHCDDCGRSLRLVSAHELSDRQSANWRLEVVSAPGEFMRGEHVLLAGNAPIDVGSGEGKHLRLIGKFVSPDHCRLVPTDDGWTLEDTAGSNGVFVNAERVTSASLNPGDVLRVGGYELRYAPAGRAAPVAPRAPARIEPLPTTPSPRETFEEAPAEEEFGNYQVEYDLAEAPPPNPPPRPLIPATTPSLAYARAVPAAASPAAGAPCPCCRRTLGPGARICVDCGIDVRTGRPLLTAQGLDEDALHVHAESTARVISWVIPLGVYPIGSEARGDAKPYAVWSIAVFTVLVSFVFFGFMWAAPEGVLPLGSDLMLWAGDQAAAAEEARELLDMLEDAEQAARSTPTKQSNFATWPSSRRFRFSRISSSLTPCCTTAFCTWRATCCSCWCWARA